MSPIPSGPLDPGLFSGLVDRLKQRFHNMPDDMRREAMEQAMEETVGKAFDAATAKCHHYAAGANLLEPRDRLAHFNTLSLGNWMELCHSAGIACVPARLAGVMRPTAAFGLSMGDVDTMTEADRAALSDISAALAGAGPNDVLRWDAGMGERIKVFGQASLAPIGEARGWAETQEGHRLPVFGSERLSNMFLAWPDPNPHNGMPCWIRPWTDARRIPAIAPDGEDILTPVEWRVYVRDGEPVAVSSFYPSLADAPGDRDLEEMALALDATRNLLGLMKEARLAPHHPRYELRDDLDPDAVHFTVDFLALPGEQASILMLEAGPAHLRNPNFGASPCCFGPSIPPRGIAHGSFVDPDFDLRSLTMGPVVNPANGLRDGCGSPADRDDGGMSPA